MAKYTQAQYQALLRAVAAGALSVTYDGMTTTYRSQNDMLELIRIIEDDLGITPTDGLGNPVVRTRQVRITSRKGLT
jgi:hypothetical protein